MVRKLAAWVARVKSGCFAGFGRTGQAIDVDPRRTGVHQQASQGLGRGAGGQYIVDQRQVQAFDDGAGCQGESVAQVLSAGLGVQGLLGVGVLVA